MNIGIHLSSTGGYKRMADMAVKLGGNTFQFFTRNPRGGQAKPIDPKDTENFIKISKEKSFSKIVAHAPYTFNLCSANENIKNFTKKTMIDDIKRMEYIPGNYYNFHPGNHVGQGIQTGIEIISESLNEIINENQTTIVLLETMSGKGSEVGGKFEELKEIIDRVDIKNKIGVCLDTCHVHDAGYDIVNNFGKVLNEFDKIIGLDRLKAIHLNDSKNACGSRKDRHEKIGKGYIGEDAVKKIVNDEKVKHLPFLLETPHEDLVGYKEEIDFVKSMRK
jgi:deoxyribonuclease-4